MCYRLYISYSSDIRYLDVGHPEIWIPGYHILRITSHDMQNAGMCGLLSLVNTSVWRPHHMQYGVPSMCPPRCGVLQPLFWMRLGARSWIHDTTNIQFVTTCDPFMPLGCNTVGVMVRTRDIHGYATEWHIR